jgi:hypothetical protein
MKLNLDLTYDGAIMDQLSEIVKLEAGNKCPVKDNQIAKLYKKLVLQTLETHLPKTIEITLQSLKIDPLDILE